MKQRSSITDRQHSPQLCARYGAHVRSIVASLILLSCVGLEMCQGTYAVTEKCPNEKARVGASASLPDCRAYELVTTGDLSRTTDMNFENNQDNAAVSSEGEHVVLATKGAFIEPEVSVSGTSAVFSRTPDGWRMSSAVAPGMTGNTNVFTLLSPDLSQVVLNLTNALTEVNTGKTQEHTYDLGPIGGPYSILVNDVGEGTSIVGANAGTSTVPALTRVIIESTDHTLLPPGPERTAAEDTIANAPNLYEWANGELRLVNVEREGPYVKLANRCGAKLGASGASEGAGAAGAVSADGSKIFFVTEATGIKCEGPSSLYMRVNDKETIEVSRPAPAVSLEPGELHEVRYNGASSDGSRVFFNTSTPLTANETPAEKSVNKLYMYETVSSSLTLIRSGVPVTRGGNGRFVITSKDGSTIYYNTGEQLYRYSVASKESTFVAGVSSPTFFSEPSYTTPDGRFLVFASGRGGVELPPAGSHRFELRGIGHNELYRYDADDGTVLCVSCGDVIAPADGEMLEPLFGGAVLTTNDEIPPFVQMSEDGQKVFFETTAQLVPQDQNSTFVELSRGTGGNPGMDVYEWEAGGTHGCTLTQGCTSLLSSGEDVGAARYLGASRDGGDVFFATSAQLVPEAAHGYGNIYDARIDGGFATQAPSPPCSSCQGVGSSALQFNTPASGSFFGVGNLHPPATLQKPKCRHGLRRNRRGRCIKAARRKRAERL